MRQQRISRAQHASMAFFPAAKEADMRTSHSEIHLVRRIGWLRAAVLGANDGIISTASLVAGVAAASTGPNDVLIAGAAGLLAGAMSMAAGEYVSVSSQADTESADLARETQELALQPAAELEELTQIYIARGVAPDVARQVSIQLTAKDALGAHAREELGLTEQIAANPIQAAIASASTFAAGAAVPLALAALAPPTVLGFVVAAGSLVSLACLGALGAWIGGAEALKPVLRVTFWGAFAMGATAAIGALVGHRI